MALQIGLPGQGGITRLTVGIDLGTTNSLVATVKDNEPRVIPDADGKALIPSVVAYTEAGVLVGRKAQEVSVERPGDTIVSVKRLMGRSAGDPEVEQTARGHRITSGEEGLIRLEAGGRDVTPVEVSAEILRALKAQAEKSLKRRVVNVVITVPAYFDDAQRQATRDAGKLAGLEVMRLLNEPTAAALAYGLDRDREGIYAVYDLGGGTFDISILKLSSGIFEVLSTGGNTHLGGDDMDEAVAELMLREAGYAPDTGDLDARVRREARQAARRAKEALTDSDCVSLQISAPDGGIYRRKLWRHELESLIRPIVERTGAACLTAMKDAHVTPAQINGVVLVGGSTRVPLVRRYVEEVFGRTPYTGVDPDQVVAVGAAIQAALLSGWQKDVLLLDVNPLSLGLETMGGIVEKLIHRNSTVPASARQVFTTFANGQTAMDIHVLQGEREMARDCRSLARFRLRGIPPLPAGVARVEVTFSVDTDGLLRVSAKEVRTGIEQRIEVKPSYGLTDQEVERMLREALEHAHEDISERLLRDARVEGERILDATVDALEQDGDALLTPEERAPIDAVLAELRQTMEGSDHNRILALIERVDRTSLSFAQRRMERSIQKALSGQQIEKIAEELKDAPSGNHP